MRRSASARTERNPRTVPSRGRRPCRDRLGPAGAAFALFVAAGAGPLLLVSAHAGESGDRDEGRLAVQAADPAEAASPGKAPEMALAERLLETIPDGSRLALRPLFPRETGLPEAEGRRIYELVLGALFRAAEGRPVTLLARERLTEVYRSQEDFFQADIASLLRAARADVEVICNASPTEDGVTLSCSAVRTAVTVGRGEAHFPLDRRGISLSLALAAIAGQLVEEAPDVGSVEQVLLTESSLGAGSDLGAWIGQRLEREVSRKMRERERQEKERARVAAVLRDAPAPSGPAPAYRLTGTIWRTGGESLWLEARLRIGRTAVAGAGSAIAHSSFPPDLLSSGGPEPPDRTYEAVAEAVVSARLDRSAALRAARNLARARVISQALALSPPGVREVATEADGVNTLGSLLGDGLTVEERFREVLPLGGAGRGDERVAVRLAAQVVPVGALVRPAVTAGLDRTVYRAGKPIEIEIRGETAAHLGVYAWGADDQVVRLYPRGTGAGLSIRAGERIVLPRPEDRTVFRSGPIPAPGNREDHAAFVVVAAPRPIDFAALAPRAGRNVEDSILKAVDGSRFLTALAGQDPARMAVLFLPFQVYK